jgi:saccharopine dehydrogenase-like NADP-dependent oxidoreductase
MKKSKCSEILLHILKDKWTLHKNDIDLIAMYHSFIYEEDNKEKKIISYLKLEGEDSIYTAMAKTVGLPIAILIEHIIISNKKFRGINLPFNRDIYEPVLKKLEKLGVVFKDKEISI